jgi:hypothetical protein
MPEPIETDAHAARVLADVLARQAAALHVVFMRTFADVLSKKERSLRDVSRALKAQNQCRIALRLLIALRAAEQSQKKSRNRTNRLLRGQNHHHDQALGKAPVGARLCRARATPQRVVDAGKGERRSPKGEGGTPRPAGGAHPRLRTMEKVDRSANCRGQSPHGLERAQARLPKPRLYRSKARGAAAPPRLRPHHRPRQNAPPRSLSRHGIGRILDPTSPNVGRSIRHSAFARSRIGWGERWERSRTCARRRTRRPNPGPCLNADQPIRRPHGHGSKPLIGAAS